MSKYLFYGAYSPEGLKGVMAEGGSGSVEAANLLTPEEMDEASGKTVDFRSPGQ